MARLSFEAIIHLPVYTRSGAYLGRVADVLLDQEQMRVEQFVVRKQHLAVLSKELLIHRNQVISLNEEKMVVEDALTKQSAEAEPVATS